MVLKDPQKVDENENISGQKCLLKTTEILWK